MNILITEIESYEQQKIAAALPEDSVTFLNKALTHQNAYEHCDVQILVLFIDSHINSSILSLLPNLKIIVTRSTGYDHIDVQAANDRNILVCNIPYYATTAVAEYTFALMLALSRSICTVQKQYQNTCTIQKSRIQGYELKNKMIGIIGTGAIGKEVALISHGLGMHSIGYDINKDKNVSDLITYLDLSDLLKKADIITLHLPATPDTKHIINQETLKLMKSTSLLINTARASLIDVNALITALENKTIAGCAIDVIEDLPHEQLSKLCHLPNCLVSPHNAYNTYEAKQRQIEATIYTIEKFKEGAPINVVKPT